MTPTADRVVAVVEVAVRSMIEALPAEHWRHVEPGLVAYISGLPIPDTNTVGVTALDADSDAVRRCLQALDASDLPYTMMVRPGLATAMSALAAEFDMVPGEEVPLMSVDITSIREQPITGPQPLFRELPYEERHIHAEIMADAFEAPVELVRQFIDIISGSPGFRAFIAEVDGEPVSTAVSVLAEESSVGIFNVATPETHQRHGYGAAVTTHAIRASVSPLTTSAWLQSSPAGLAVYQRIGFETVETWPTWTSSAST